MPVSWNLAQAAYAMFYDGHTIAVGDSQTSMTDCYLWSYAWPIVSRINFAGIVASSANVTANIHSRGLYSTGATWTRQEEGNDDALKSWTGVNAGAADQTVMRNTTSLIFTGDTPDFTDFNSGTLINKQSNYAWPNVNGYGRPWFNDCYLCAKQVFMDGTGATVPCLGSWWTYLERSGSGASAVNSGATVITAGATLKISASAGTSPLADPGNFSTNNDHEVRLHTQIRNNGADETGKAIVHVAAPIYRADSSGNAQRGVYLDNVGRAGFSATEILSVGMSQTHWQEYLAATIVHPDANVRIVIWLMLGHNAEGAEQTGGAFNSTWKQNVSDEMDRLVAAAVAAFPSARVLPVLCFPWLGAGSAIADATAGESGEALMLALAQSKGWGFYSFFSAFAKALPFATLHPAANADGLLLGARMKGDLLACLARQPRNRVGASRRFTGP